MWIPFRSDAHNSHYYSLKALNDEQILLLEDILEYELVEKDEVVVKEGATEDTFYIISRGSCEVSQMLEGRNRKLIDLHAGNYFGELALLEDLPRQARITAIDESVLLILKKNHFENLCKVCPELKTDLERSIQLRTAQNFREYNVPFFTGLTDEQLNVILELCRTYEYEPGQEIIKQGQPAKSFFVLEIGEVEVTRVDNETGEKQALGTLHKGTYFGEIALITDKTRVATVTAKTKCICLSFHKDTFSNLFAHSSQARADFELKVLGNKVELIHILRHPDGLELFTKHMDKEFCPESIEFWRDVIQLDHIGADDPALKMYCQKIYDTYISEEAPKQVSFKEEREREDYLSMLRPGEE